MFPDAHFRSTDIAVGYPLYPIRETAAAGSAPSNSSAVRTFDQDGMHPARATQPVPTMPAHVQRTVIGGSAVSERRGTVIITSNGDTISPGDSSSQRNASYSSDYKNGTGSDSSLSDGKSGDSPSSFVCSEAVDSGDSSGGGSDSSGADSGGSDSGGCVIS